MRQYDVGIIGAGVLGAAIARELSRYELSILWLEKAADVATGVTRGNTSIVHGGFDDAKGSVKGSFSPCGMALIEALDSQLHFGFHKCGSLVVALDSDDRPVLEALLANGQSNGVQGLELWGSSELREREPKLNPEAACALYSRNSGVLVAPEFCIALAENAVANGAELHLGEELLALRSLATPMPLSLHAGKNGETGAAGTADKNIGYQLETAKGSYSCSYLINAAGWGAPKISQMLGSLDYQLQPIKGQYLVFDRSCGEMAQHVLFPLPDKIKGKGVTVCPTYHGNLLLGPDAEFVDDPNDLSTQLGNLRQIYRQAQKLLPGIPRSKVIRSYAGMRPCLKSQQTQSEKTKSGDFLLRYQPDRCELLGIASPGITAALPIAEELAAKLAEVWNFRGRKLELKRNFNKERSPYTSSQRNKKFLSGRELKDLTELPLTDPECLICRCEQVKSGVIQEALRRNGRDFAAVRQNLDYLKWRTRTTMGFCQGQFCKPRLKALVSELAGVDMQVIDSEARNWQRVAPKELRNLL